MNLLLGKISWKSFLQNIRESDSYYQQRLSQCAWIVNDARKIRDGFSERMRRDRTFMPFVAAWILASGKFGEQREVPLLFTTKPVESENVAVCLATQLEHYRTWQDSGNDHSAKALVACIEAHLVCRRFEIHDVSASILFHIVMRGVDEALRRANGPERNSSKRRASGKLRVVIDDLRNLQDLYPNAIGEPLLLPSLLSYLQNVGATTMLIHTQPGRPASPLVERHIYSWRVPFFGEHRMAISVIPPFRGKATVGELLWTDNREPPLVDPHFELYRGLEAGDPQAVSLQVRLYRESDAFDTFVQGENQLFQELFRPVPGKNVIVAEATLYETLRDLTALQKDTRLDHTLIVQVDEFWVSDRTGSGRSLRSQETYLLAPTFKESGPDSVADPYGVFQPSQAGSGSGSSIADRFGRRGPYDRAFYFRHYFRDVAGLSEVPNTDLSESADSSPAPESSASKQIWQHLYPRTDKQAKDAGIKDLWSRESFVVKRNMETVPFMWDFGFLLLRQLPWMRAVHLAEKGDLDNGDSGNVKYVWDNLRRVSETKGGSQHLKPVGWRESFEACRDVAFLDDRRATGGQIGQTRPFDVSMLSPETFTCLCLEMWASEIDKTCCEEISGPKNWYEDLTIRHWDFELSRLSWKWRTVFRR